MIQFLAPSILERKTVTYFTRHIALNKGIKGSKLFKNNGSY